MTASSCRSCGAPLGHVILDLGMSPLSNALVDSARADSPEMTYPLALYACDRCWLVQLPAFERRERIFGDDYPYLSSYSTTWLAHARAFADGAVHRYGLGSSSFVVELASNDGCTLNEFAKRSVPVLGIEPAENVAKIAQAAGIPTTVAFFGRRLAEEIVASGRRADLIIANNVLAHVPDLDDFVGGIATLLASEGIASIEVPHLLRLVERAEFDTVYHEHFSYFSLTTASAILAARGLRVVDVEELPTHGGSLRIMAMRADGSGADKQSSDVRRILAAERAARLDSLAGYAGLQAAAERVRHELRSFLVGAHRNGKTVAGYGAPAKATTLLNFCGIGADLLPFTVDRNPHKQGKLIPGVRIPIRPPAALDAARLDYVMILPWNIADEVREQLSPLEARGVRFAVPIPSLAILPPAARTA